MTRPVVITALVVAAFGTVMFFVTDRLPQDPTYHDFVDDRPWLGIPNAADVLSNLPFLIVGWLGLRAARRRLLTTGEHANVAWAVFFFGVAGTAIGSAWYHLVPDNERLVWDRLPMAVSFAALLAVVIGERTATIRADRALIPLLLIAVGSVVIWAVSERLGAGDLRLYGLVQFGSIVGVVGLLAWPRPFAWSRPDGYIEALVFYALAKVTEARDDEIMNALGGVSGHTVKHLLAAAATLCIYHMLRSRHRILRDTERPSDRPHADHPIVFYDGNCGMCDQSVRFLLARDGGRFHFAALESDVAAEVLAPWPVDPKTSKSMFVVTRRGDRVRLRCRSDAALHLAGHLAGAWKLVALGRFVPSFLRDPVYDVIARNRHRFAPPTCPVNREGGDRFLDVPPTNEAAIEATNKTTNETNA